MPEPYIVQINVNPQGGVPKHPTPHADITQAGVRGDHQRDTAHHGGPNRAVSLYALELIHALQAEGHPVTPGSMGENLTVAGLDWASLAPGNQLQLGDRVVIEITGYATPCKTIQASFADGNFKRVAQKLHPGWSRLYARVIIEGRVTVNDPISDALVF